ncbi:hypothetical protein DFH28DRAFT_926893 [Melampsora americana]|nr:hypothetical protein DFH28DRAFT_926893 [Melampsora americana]
MFKHSPVAQRPGTPTPTIVTPKNSLTESSAVRRGHGQPKKSKSEQEMPAETLWFGEGEGDFSNMEIVALCKITNAGVLSEYMAKKNFPSRPPRGCYRNIAWVEEKFKIAFEVVNLTGQGILNNEDYRQELNKMDLLLSTVNSDGKEECIGKICENSKARCCYQPTQGTTLECISDTVVDYCKKVLATYSNNEIKKSDNDHSDAKSNQLLVESGVEDGNEKIEVKVLKETKVSVPQRHNKRMRQESRHRSLP